MYIYICVSNLLDIVYIKNLDILISGCARCSAPQRLIEVHRRVDPQGAIGQANHRHLSTHLGRQKPGVTDEFSRFQGRSTLNL